MVLAWTYHDSSKISGKILVKPYMLVLVVSNNTNLNSTLAQSKFHNLLLHISMASLQAPTQPPNLPPFTENNYLNISDGLPVVVFRDSIRLATPTGHNVSKTLGILQNAWQDVLGKQDPMQMFHSKQALAFGTGKKCTSKRSSLPLVITFI